MATIITNHVRASKQVIDALHNTIPGHEFEGHVDFNCIVPTPENVSQEEGPAEDAYAQGMIYWRDWNESNWGTKWNAGDSERRSDTSVYFNTANAPACTVMIALSLQFPGEIIELRTAQEIISAFAMRYVYLDGEEFEDSTLRAERKKMKRLASNVKHRRLA